MKKFFYLLLAVVSFSFMSCAELFGSLVEPSSVDSSSITQEAFMDGVLLSWAPVTYATEYKLEYNNKTTVVSSPSCFIPADPDTSKYPYFGISVSVKIYACNKAGNSTWTTVYAKSQPIYNDSSEDYITYEITGKTSTSVSIKFNGLKISEKGSYKIAVTNDTYSNTLIKAGDENCDEITLEGLDPATNFNYGYYVTVTSDVDGVKKSFKSEYRNKLSFSTNSFEAPANVKVDSIGRTVATISYSPLTEAQLEGVDTSKVRYIVDYEDADGNKRSKNGENGSTDPIKVTGLKSETKYTFTVHAGFDYHSGDNKSSEPVTATTLKGIIAPGELTLSESAGSKSYTQNLNVKFEEPNEDSSILYRVEYKVLKSSSYTNTDGEKSAAAAYSSDGITTEVNGGNRYIVRVAAYDPAEDFSVYSPEKSIQLTKFDDNAKTGTAVYQGIYNVETGELLKGYIKDIHVSNSSYVYDMLPGNKFLYKNNGGTFAYDVTDALNSENKLYMIYLDYFKNSKVTISKKSYDIAYMNTTAIIKPDAEKSYERVDFNGMSSQKSDGTWDKPENLSIVYKNSILDSFIYNNQLYIYLKYASSSKESEYVGFSFVY